MIRNATIGLLSLMGITGCAPLGPVATERVASSAIMKSDGAAAGNLQVFAAKDELILSAAFFSLPAGPHAVHLHQVGTCDGPAFTSAGAHLNPSGANHGTADGKQGHLGDLPNVEIKASGSTAYEARISGIPSAILAEIQDADGTAIVVHESPDDYRTDPSGAAGARIACGVLTAN
ncbi:superoxide dismutase family protein [Altererythrobacter aquiaggeris]|uniref:superoxide dismutase family protein n=1 Tax=Aestuarierythrobacter aquiaggeris TaxID=1898396 RepID=UPI00301AF8A7